jgi:hypothetical protein
VPDLAIFVCRAKQHFQQACRCEHLYDLEHPVIDRIGLQGGAMTVSMCTDNPKLHDDIKLFSRALSEDDELLGERLRVLGAMLKEMGYAR